MDINYFSKALAGFMELLPEEDIYAYIGENVRRLAGDAIIGINSYDHKTGLFTNRYITGLNKHIEKVVSILGMNPVNMALPMIKEVRENLEAGKLIRVEDGLYSLLCRVIPKELCAVIEKALNISDVYVMAFVRKKDILAALGIVTFRDAGLKNMEAIELFVNLSSIALQHYIAEKGRRIAYDNLRESNRNIITVLNSISDAFFSIDDNFRMTYFNKAAEHITGKESRDVLGKDFLEVFPEARGSIFEINYREAIRTKKPVSFEVYFDKEPYVNWYEVNVFPQENGISVYFRVTSENKKAERKIKESEEWFRTLVESMDDVVCMLDRQQRYIGMYGRRVTEHRLNPQLYLGKTVLEALGEDIGRKHYEMNEKALSGENVVYEWEVKQGNVTNYFHTSASPIRDADNSIVGIVAVVRDVTDVKHLEQQVMQTQKMESLGMLVAGIAHDFNNSLSAILGNAELIEMDMTEGGKTEGGNAVDSVLEEARNIIVASNKAKDLTQQLLGFAKQGKYNPKEIDINNSVREVVKILEKGFISTTFYRIETKLYAENHIFADEAQIHVILQNLAINARDAMQNGGVIAVSTADKILDDEIDAVNDNVLPGSYVVLGVSDTGSGIEKSVLTKMFEPFFTTKEKGTGLGLSAVWGIVKNHRAYIDVKTEQGRGTNFEIYFPSLKPEKIPVGKDAKDSFRGKGNILVVEDNPSIMKFMTGFLKSQGYTVYSAGDGQEALELFGRIKDIELVITDLILPVMDGAELCGRIRELKPDIALYVVSGYYNDEKVQEIMKKGVRGFLNKPFTLEQLGKIVKEGLNVT